MYRNSKIIPDLGPDPEEPECRCKPSLDIDLHTANWSQHYPYNTKTPIINGSNAVVGCVPLAGGIVIHYHEPHKYNDKESRNTMLRILGDLVDVDYGSDVTSAKTKDLVGALNTYGYSATFTDYNRSTVANNIKFGKPVIMRGAKNWYSNMRHAWVCDGVYETYLCPKHNPSSYLYFYMNWGWGGYLNGRFGFHDFTPGSHDFNYKPDMIYGIYK